MQISQSAGDANTSTETGSAGGGKVVYLQRGRGLGRAIQEVQKKIKVNIGAIGVCTVVSSTLPGLPFPFSVPPTCANLVHFQFLLLTCALRGEEFFIKNW